jgi:hypothetical protein
VLLQLGLLGWLLERWLGTTGELLLEDTTL